MRGNQKFRLRETAEQPDSGGAWGWIAQLLPKPLCTTERPRNPEKSFVLVVSSAGSGPNFSPFFHYPTLHPSILAAHDKAGSRGRCSDWDRPAQSTPASP